MLIEEESLRQLLDSTYGAHCGHAIVECIQKGDELTIAMTDGTSVVVRTIEEAHTVLSNHFNWTQFPSP